MLNSLIVAEEERLKFFILQDFWPAFRLFQICGFFYGPFKVNQKWPFSGLKWIFFGFSKSGWVRTRVLKSWVWKAGLETPLLLLSIKNKWLRNWAVQQHTSWVIAPWWLSVSLWRICITFVWPRSTFASIKLCQASWMWLDSCR